MLISLRRHWWALVILGLAFVIFGGGALLSALKEAILSPADVHPPYPGSELLTTQRIWQADGLHLRRVYHTSTSQPDVINWYYERGPNLPPHLFEIPCPGIHFYTPVPKLPFPFWILRRDTFVHYCVEENGTQVTADTHYFWEYARP
jgi:hypothetical protein